MWAYVPKMYSVRDFPGLPLLFWAHVLPSSSLMLAASLFAPFQYRELKPRLFQSSGSARINNAQVSVSQRFRAVVHVLPKVFVLQVIWQPLRWKSSARRLCIAPFQMVLHMFRPITESTPADIVLMGKKSTHSHTCPPPPLRCYIVVISDFFFLSWFYFPLIYITQRMASGIF